MFKIPGKRIEEKPKYRIPENIKSNYLTDKNLWETPRPEFYSLNIPDIVFSIIEYHKEISFESIKEILKKYKVPHDLGFIHLAVKILVTENKISVTKKYTYAIKQ